jgi:hypothetical protein
MADPITWRNVTGPAIADAARPMESAAALFNAAFNPLQSVLKQREDTEFANTKQVRDNLTQNLMNRLYSANTVDGYNALMQSGEIQRAMADAGAGVDQEKLRAAMDARMGVLQDRGLKDITYNHTMTDEAQAPLVRQIQVMSRTNPKGAQALLDQHPEIRQAFEVAKDVDTQGWNLEQRGFTRNEEAFKEKERPLQLAGLRLGNEGKGLANRLANYQVKDAAQNWDDRIQTRALESAIADQAAQHSNNRDVLGTQQGALAKTLGMPTDARGWADFGNMNPEQLAKFNAAAKTSGVPLSTVMTTGDTVRADNFLQQLVAGGKISPRILRANESSIRNAFSSPVGDRALVGNDLLNVAVARAQNQVGFDRGDAANWYAPGTENALNAYEKLAQSIPGIVEKMPNGFAQKEDIPYIQEYLRNVAMEGITNKNGQKVVPSTNDILAAVRSSKGGWFWDDARKDSIKGLLENWINKPESIRAAEDGLKSQVWRDRERARQLIQETIYGAPTKK